MSANLGKLIAFEGMDGVGKTTFVKETCRWLTEECKVKAITTSALSEGATTFGKSVGDFLRNKSTGEIDPMAEALMICAARRDNWSHIILPNLMTGTWVITDRHLDSLFCYQPYLPEKNLLQILQAARIDAEAHLTFLIDIPSDHERIKRNVEDRLESKSDEWWIDCENLFHQRFNYPRRKGCFTIFNEAPLDVGMEIVKKEIKKILE